jgi:hypothetical protein
MEGKGRERKREERGARRGLASTVVPPATGTTISSPAAMDARAGFCKARGKGKGGKVKRKKGGAGRGLVPVVSLLTVACS